MLYGLFLTCAALCALSMVAFIATIVCGVLSRVFQKSFGNLNKWIRERAREMEDD